MAVYARRITWIDVNGNIRTTQVIGNGSMTAVEAALLLMSNADEAAESEAQIFVNSAPAPVAAVYQTVADQANLWYTTVGGNTVQLTVPAPRSGIFLADGMTVDPASVASLTAVATGLVTNLGGDPVATFLSGLRAR